MSLNPLCRIVLAGILFFGIPTSLSAQVIDEYVDENGDSVSVVFDATTMDYCFRHIPDDVLPTLSENNRLDMLFEDEGRGDQPSGRQERDDATHRYHAEYPDE